MPIDLKGYRLILGSSSKFRLKLLTDAGYDPQVMTLQIDEKCFGDRKNPKKLTLVPIEVARAKRDAFLKEIGTERQKALLITADQISIYGDEVWEKPRSAEIIRRRLEQLIAHAYSLQFWNGLTVTNLWTGASLEAQDCSYVGFRAIPKDKLDEIVANPEFLQCASGVMMEHPMYAPYAHSAGGGGLDSNIGLPIRLFEKLALKLLA